MEENENYFFLKKLMEALRKRRETANDELSYVDNPISAKKIKDMTPKREPDEILDITHSGINFIVKIWYDSKFNVEFKLAEALLLEFDDEEKVGNVSDIINSLFKSEEFNPKYEDNLNRLMDKYINLDDFEKAKEIKLLLDQRSIEKEYFIKFKELIEKENEKIKLDGENYCVLTDEVVSEFEKVFKAYKSKKKKTSRK